jgi:hypothetical protein
MPRETHIRDSQELQAYTEAHVLACRCQKALHAWERANEATRPQLRQAHRAALEALYQHLRADLGAMARQWIPSCATSELPASQEQQQVRQEVEDHLALNIFTAVVQALSRLAIDAKTDVRKELLDSAERSLYNRD